MDALTDTTIALLDSLGIARCHQDDTMVCVRYLCNYAYTDVLDPCKNTLFPGTVTTWLTRSHLKKLAGQTGTHLAYKETEIVPWIHPASRTVPPAVDIQTAPPGHAEIMNPKHFVFSSASQQYSMDHVDFTFDTERKTFDFLTPIPVPICDIDFGSADGTFSWDTFA